VGCLAASAVPGASGQTRRRGFGYALRRLGLNVNAGELPQLEKRYAAAKEITYRGAKLRVSE